MVKPPPATDRTCSHLRDDEGVGLEVFTGGARALVVGKCSICLWWAGDSPLQSPSLTLAVTSQPRWNM